MCQWAAKRPQVRAYLRQTRDEGLVIKGETAAEEGDSGFEKLKKVEVFSDASYPSSELKSLSGIVVCVGGTPIAWHTTRQAFVTLSTAEAELMSLLESLVSARSAGALVEAVLGGEVSLKLHSDCHSHRCRGYFVVENETSEDSGSRVDRGFEAARDLPEPCRGNGACG